MSHLGGRPGGTETFKRQSFTIYIYIFYTFEVSSIYYYYRNYFKESLSAGRLTLMNSTTHVKVSVLFTNDLLTFHCQCAVIQRSRVDHLVEADHVRTDAPCTGAACSRLRSLTCHSLLGPKGERTTVHLGPTWGPERTGRQGPGAHPALRLTLPPGPGPLTTARAASWEERAGSR